MTKVVHLYASQRVSRRAKDGKDGTSVTIISKSVTYQISASGTETPTGNWSDKVVATTDTKPYLWTRTIVVYSDTNSTTSYSVSYKGKDGAPGKDAYRVEVSPSTLVFDTNEDGVVDRSALSGKYATVTVYKGSQKISVDNLSLPSNYATKKYTNVDGRIYNTNGEARITITEIEQETISGDEKVSKSSGQISFPIDVLGERSTLMWVTVNVQVNVAKFTGSVVANNKKFETNFAEISNRFENTPTNKDLTDAESRITQTAREISLSVSEKSVGRRNMLVGSAFLREDNNCTISSDARIEMNSGYNGTNCIKVFDDTDGTSHYIGVYWDGSQGGRSIKIEKGKKYTISCYYKSNNINANFLLETIYTDKETNAKRLGRPKNLSPSTFTPKKVNEWQLCTTVIDTTDAESDYIAFNFWEYCESESGRIEAYICRPMVEEGDTYGGWTLSQNDYDIIGANLIDNSRTLDTGGNVLEAKGQKALVGDAYELTYIGSDDYNTFYRIKGSTFKLNTDYTISFEVRGDAKYMGVYVYYPITNTKFTFYAEPQNGAMTEVTDGGKVDNYVALIQVNELSKQQRVWSHFRFKDRLPDLIYFQFPKNAEQIGVTSWSVTITRPKIEVGAVVTEFTERKSDLVDKASLKKAGIEITSDQVTLYGNKVQVKTPKANPSEGYDEAAMFQNGKLNANLIDAKNIVTQGLRTGDIDAERATIKNLSIIGSSRNPFTRMSKGTNVDYSNNVSVITNINYEFVTSNYELKWDNSQNGRRITLLNYRWRNEFAYGGATINAPEGKYFFEDGLKKSALKFSRQYVELLGIGDDTAFYGWVVVNKIDVSSVFGYGHVAKVLAYGSLVATIENNKLKLTLLQKTFDGQKITVEQDVIGYKLRFPSSWGNAGNFVPNITPYKFIGNIYIYERGDDYIIIRYSGKSSENRNWEDASFLFSIQTAADFEWLNKDT